MKMRATATVLFLATHISNAEALHPSDPVICYILDVILLLYSILFTALYFREKFLKKKPVQDTSEPTAPARNPNEPVYTDLDLPQMDSDYQQLNRPIRRREEETQYQELRGQSNDEYQRINIAGRKARTGRRRDAPEAVEMYTLPQ